MRIRISFLALGIMIFIGACNNSTSEINSEAGSEESHGNAVIAEAGDIKPEYLTAVSFREKVWDYEKNPEKWVYNGDIPCIIDFYADWCKPCKKVAPIMDDLADYYDGRVLIYKVNTDEERELAAVFQVNSIPSILFAPANGGKPAIQPGALSKEDYIRIIDEFVLNENNQNNKNTESL